MADEQHEPRPNPETEEERREREHDEEMDGGFTLRGPVGFGARFPKSAASESKWIIRGIAIAIPILATLYGLSWFL